MSIEENKAIVRRAFEFFDWGELEAYFEFLAPEYVDHATTRVLSLEQDKQFYTMFFSAFPDCSVTIEDMVAEGDKVAYRITVRGTHKGEFMGIAPTGNKIEMINTAIVKIVDGKFVETRATIDGLRLMQQLGVIPT